MFPLKSEFSLPGKAPAVFLLIIFNSAIFIFSSIVDRVFFIYQYGLLPVRFFSQFDYATLLSSMFLHANIWHLLGNMWFLGVFGKNVEKRLGSLRFLFFYLLSGIVAGGFYLVFSFHSVIPAVGASGAISGVLGAYLFLFPKSRILTLVPIFFFWHLVYLPSALFLGIWFLYQILSLGSATNVAYLAHIAGFLFGWGFAKKFFKKYRLWQKIV